MQDGEWTAIRRIRSIEGPDGSLSRDVNATATHVVRSADLPHRQLVSFELLISCQVVAANCPPRPFLILDAGCIDRGKPQILDVEVGCQQTPQYLLSPHVGTVPSGTRRTWNLLVVVTCSGLGQISALPSATWSPP